MKNLSRKDDLNLTQQRISKTLRTDENRFPDYDRGGDVVLADFAADLEIELDQAIRERDQARSNVKPMGAVTIARNGYIQEIEAQRDKAISERDRAQAALRTLIALHQREIETGEPISGEEWEIAGYGLGDE
jgi:hypothetical protein